MQVNTAYPLTDEILETYRAVIGKEVCNAYLEKEGLTHWQQEIQIIIDMHHLLSEYTGPYARLVEAFRKADLVDFSLGLVRNGVEKPFVKAVKQALPNSGFHACLGRFTLK